MQNNCIKVKKKQKKNTKKKQAVYFTFLKKTNSVRRKRLKFLVLYNAPHTIFKIKRNFRSGLSTESFLTICDFKYR